MSGMDDPGKHTNETDQVTVHIAAPPEVVYALVTDITRTPELDPEVRGGAWQAGVPGPAVGARFRIVRERAGRTWKTDFMVVVARPGRDFAVTDADRHTGTVVWRYRMEPDGTGTRLTQSYEVTKAGTMVGRFILQRRHGAGDRRAARKQNMRETLERIRAVAESSDSEQR